MTTVAESRRAPLREWLNALRDPEHGPRDAGVRYVLLMLSTYMNNHGAECFPSQAELARALLFTERGAHKNLKAAERTGWLQVTKHGIPGKAWARNSYYASIPAGIPLAEPLGDDSADPLHRPEPRFGTNGVNGPEPPFGTTREGPEPGGMNVPNHGSGRSRTVVLTTIPITVPETVPHREDVANARTRAADTSTLRVVIESVRREYPRGDHGGEERWRRAGSAIRRLLALGTEPSALVDAARRYARQAEQFGTDPQFVQAPDKFYGRGFWKDHAGKATERAS